MKFVACLWLSLTLILSNNVDLSWTTHWDLFVSSHHYVNSRLVTEMANPFELFTVSKEYPLLSTRILCSQFCANNASCWGFNFYATNIDYVCEFLPDNYCFNRKRVALQTWPGGNVWDKLSPGKTKACIDQELDTSITNKYCEILRPGCVNTTSSTNEVTVCNSSCVRSCVDCASIYPAMTSKDYYECTLWPEGPFEPPIFAMCQRTAVYLALREVNPSNGIVSPDHRLSPTDMHRISRLNVYKIFYLGFRSGGAVYLAFYANFSIDADGSLMNMTFLKGDGGDGFNIGSTPLKPSPWVETTSNCGSFWLLNSTQTAATMQCPGGGVGLFGTVNVSTSPKRTGIVWPKATAAGKVLEHGDIKLTL